MLLIAAASLSLFGHLPHLSMPGHAKPLAQTTAEATLPARVGPWRVAGRLDRFSETRGCSVSARGVSVHRGALVFRVAARGDTRGAVFRLDGGPPHAVADVFDRVEARGFFPQRGWLLDPEGGEAVLPAEALSGASTIAIQTVSGHRPTRFAVARLDAALATARAAGCPAPLP